ncbi:MAG: hypothetical protein ACI92I_000054 [Acidimicrobiales bacterium]|jgi:hypothetical protein
MNLIKKILNNIFAPYRPNKSRTVRFAFPLLFVVAAFLGASVIDSTSQTNIRIESSASSVREGEIFKINVFVSAHVPVNAIDIALAFPDVQVEVLGIDTGQSVITLWTEQPYVQDNTVVLRGGTFRKGFLGDHLIATVRAKANTSGLATFEIADSRLIAGDGSGLEVAVTDSGEESTQLYVANEDGKYDPSNGSSVEGSVTVRIVTDINGDGKVSLADLSRFMAAWTSKTEVYDFTGDGRMTFRDFAVILSDSFFK